MFSPSCPSLSLSLPAEQCEIFLEHLGWDPFATQTKTQKMSLREILETEAERLTPNGESRYLFDLLCCLVRVQFSPSAAHRAETETTTTADTATTATTTTTDERLDAIISRRTVSPQSSHMVVRGSPVKPQTPPDPPLLQNRLRLGYKLPAGASRGQTELCWLPESPPLKKRKRYIDSSEDKEEEGQLRELVRVFQCSESPE